MSEPELKHKKNDIDRHPVRSIVKTIADLCIIAGVALGCFVLWLMLWTGIESAQEQAQQATTKTANWDSKSVDLSAGAKIAKAQKGDPPSLSSPAYGDLLGQLYIPRFGAKWVRNVVQGTDYYQLARHGLGHYEDKAMPGQVGLFAVAGHRAGYGEPLAYIDRFQDGDYIVMRTNDYWFVYKYYDHKVVGYKEGQAVSDVPFKPGATPTERLMALTSCEPRYYMGGGETPYRWVAYAKFQYWAKVSDGTPKELINTGTSTTPTFSFENTSNLINGMATHIPSKKTIVSMLVAAYASVYIAALVAWQYAGIGEWREKKTRQSIVFSPLEWLVRLQPGNKPIRIVLMTLLALLFISVLTMYVSPICAQQVPFLSTSAAL